MILVVLSAACTSKSEQAEKEYEIVQNSPGATAADICEKGRAVAQAYLEEGNAKKYNESQLMTRIRCRLAEQDEE